MDVRRSVRPAQFTAFGLFLGVGLACLMGQAGSGASGQKPPVPGTAREAGSTIVLTTQAPDTSQLLYIVDTQSQSFAVYRVDPRDSKGAVKLEAARQYRWDMKLAEFNNQAPEVATIESMVGTPRR